MSSRDYRKIIVEKLLKKYNTRLAQNTSTTRRIILKPTEVYKNYTENNADISIKQNLDEAVDALLKMKMITVDYLKFSTDVEKIYLCEEQIGVIYEWLKAEYGITPQNVLVKKAKALLENYFCDGKVMEYYRYQLSLLLQDPRTELNLDNLEANLKMIYFLETNMNDLYVREASMLVYGDSKWFEEHNYNEVCNLLREALHMPAQDNERCDAILALYHIAPTEQEIFIKGNWKLEWENCTLEIGKLKGGIAINSRDIERLKSITVGAEKIMTIENKTSYQRVDDSNIATIYLGGYATRYQILFLQKVIQNNPRALYCHFGDIDVGGFLIHRHLCNVTGKQFKLHCMGIEELTDERFVRCHKELTDNDRKRMQLLLSEEPYTQIMRYMEENNVKLEQEIVSYYSPHTSPSSDLGTAESPAVHK